MHDRDGEVVLCHGLLKLLDSFLGVAIDKSLVDVKVGVEVKENLHLPLFFLYSDVVLVDTLEGELLVLNKNLRGVPHEMLGELKNIVGKGGRK